MTEAGQLVRQLRQQRGMTQAELAKLAGRSVSWVAKLEHGEREIGHLDVAKRIADEFGIEHEGLMVGSKKQAIAESIERDIVGGVLRPGDQLPSDRDLAVMHGVARNTARDAVKLLVDRKLVKTVHGAGSFVAEPPADEMSSTAIWNSSPGLVFTVTVTLATFEATKEHRQFVGQIAFDLMDSLQFAAESAGLVQS